MRTLIRHGRLVLDSGIVEADLLVEDERIAAIGEGLNAADAKVIDASGCYVLPGFIDFHTHVDDRIGRFYLADDYESGTRVAALNGITTLCTFVTQSPENTLRQALQAAQDKAEGHCHADVAWHLTPTSFGEDDWREMEALVAAGYRTFKFYTTYRNAGIYVDEARLETIFRRLGPLGVHFLIHCEDDAIIASVDPVRMELARGSAHARLRPEEAEILSVDALLALAARCGVSLHIVHVSTTTAAERIRSARGKQDVTCETCPQYLWLDESWLDRPDGHRWICSPPLRNDRVHFRELAFEGAFDLFGTDHCAFTRTDKDDRDKWDVRTVANGLAGIGALPHLVWKLWENDPNRAARELALRLSRNPATRLGMTDRKGALRVGLDADIAILDPHGPLRPIRSTLADAFETYPDFSTTLSFRQVLLRGACLVEHDALMDPGHLPGRALQGLA
jgi:dihydropyrimidinase